MLRSSDAPPPEGMLLTHVLDEVLPGFFAQLDLEHQRATSTLADPLAAGLTAGHALIWASQVMLARRLRAPAHVCLLSSCLSLLNGCLALLNGCLPLLNG